MCGRFGATFTFREIMVRWNLQRDIPLYAPRFNIGPSQQVPVIVSTDNAPDAKPMQWGLVTWWAKDQAIRNRMINARAETLTEKRVPSKTFLIDGAAWFSLTVSTSGGRKGSARSLCVLFEEQGAFRFCGFVGPCQLI
jgi:SOS response associated peptidase (SRAP)